MVDLSKMAEQRLQEAVKKGDLDDLPGQGKPLVEDPGAALPQELRIAYKILKNHGMVPREVELLKNIDQARERFEMADPESRERSRQQLEELCLEYNVMRNSSAQVEQSSLKDKK